jgi:hypothetical protein
MEKPKMPILRGIAVIGLIGLFSPSAWSANTVAVDSKTVCTGAQGVTIAVKLTNDRELRHVTVPLEVRSLSGGAFITSLKMSWSDRMPAGRKTPLGENSFANQYHERDCVCAKDKVPGYGKIAFSDTLSHAVESAPIGVLFSRFRMMGANLPPGADSGGSIRLTVDIGDKAGGIEVDTACVCPSHTLMFVDVSQTPKPIFPTFTKGVITVEACGDKGK